MLSNVFKDKLEGRKNGHHNHLVNKLLSYKDQRETNFQTRNGGKVTSYFFSIPKYH